MHTPWKDAAWHNREWFSVLHSKVDNAICGLVRMEPKDQRARLQLLAELSSCPQLRVKLSLQSVCALLRTHCLKHSSQCTLDDVKSHIVIAQYIVGNICLQPPTYGEGFAFGGICEAAGRHVRKRVVHIAAPRSA